jgi:membrane-bound lytic murein transglycosylase F
LTQVFGEWLALPATARLIKDLRQAYFARPRKFDPFDIKVFLNRMGSRLPKFIDYFRKAGEVNALPWQLLAAIGYQESHWDETAESPTGVQGIMMLTRRAAKDLGVVDRTSAEESIFGGAKFFARLLKRLPEFLPPQERYWFALAAYNLGYGHLQDGRRLAIELNLNANLWEDVRKALPLLTQDKHFRDTRYGYARGHEAVVYVQRVRTYYESLKKRYPR